MSAKLSFIVILIAAGADPARAWDVDSPYAVTAFIPSTTRWDAIAGAGIGWGRCGFGWREIETAQDVFNWATTDNAVTQANARGIKIYAGLGYTPAWASAGGGQEDPPTNPADWYDFVFQCVSRYKDDIKYWELWNEPNLSFFWGGTRSQFINDILKVGADAVHAADPDAMVVAPELSSCCQASTWMQECLQQVGDRIDIICYHQYDGGDAPAGRLSALDSMHNFIDSIGYGGKPLWNSECGFRSDASGMNERKQGEYLIDMLEGTNARPWLQAFYWYQIWEAEAGERWGLLYQDQTPKPSWYAYREYTFAHPAPERVSVNLSTADIEDGLTRVVVSDGDTVAATQASRSCRRNTDPAGDHYAYFNVDDGFALAGNRPDVVVLVDYYDGGTGAITLQYDSSTAAYKNDATVNLTGVNTWKQARFVLADAHFGNRQNGGADFRIHGGSNVFHLDVVSVTANRPPAQAPYLDPTFAVPGVIEAELYDLGGEGVAYHDLSGDNAGDLLRFEDVDVESTTDAGGGYNVGWIDTGEWLEYTMDVTQTASYEIGLRVASDNAGGSFHVEIDGQDVTGLQTFGATGGWQNWVTVASGGVMLNSSAGRVLRVVVDAGGWNLNFIELTKEAALPGPASSPDPPDLATDMSIDVDLSWTAGTLATSHDVHFGTTNPPPLQGNQPQTTYDPGTLVGGTMYHWRIDEVNDDGTTAGPVWSFTTLPRPGLASNPDPPNSGVSASLYGELSWQPGSGAVSHDVYFGTDNPPTFQANVTTPQYYPGALFVGMTYYWRIDGRNGAGVTQGVQWQFTGDGFPGDFNIDGDVDQSDFGYLQTCLSGSAQLPELGCEQADLDGDHDVDAEDVDVFRGCMAGEAGEPPC